jgi:hypothetical protein
MVLFWLAHPRLGTFSLPALPRSHRCGSCANESAFKAAFMTYRHRQRQSSGEPEFTPEEMSSCMRNAAPGSPDLTVLSFTSAFHGRLFGSLSATRSKAIHKVRCELLRPGVRERRTDHGYRRDDKQVDIPSFDCESWRAPLRGVTGADTIRAGAGRHQGRLYRGRTSSTHSKTTFRRTRKQRRRAWQR